MALGRKPIEMVNDAKHQLLAKAEHWDRIYLKEVAKVQNGYAFSSDYFTKSNGMPLIRIRDIDNFTTVDRFSGNYNKNFIVKKGDILIGMDGDFKTARWKGENALLNQRVCRIIPTSKNYNDKFLVFCLQPFLDAIHAETSSVTVKHISSKTIEEIPLPLPSKKEQDAIVSKIEELFSEIENGIKSLFAARQQLKTYRQSVLKWAFEGKLTNENVKDGELPEGWGWVKFGELFSESPQNGLYKSSTEYGSGTPIIRIDGFYDGSILDDYQYKRVRLTDEETSRYSISVGDILVNRVNSMPYLGKCGIVKQVKEKTVFESNIMKVRLNKKIALPEYFTMYLSSKKGVTELRKNAKQAVNQASINQTDVSNVMVPLPLIDEQNKIVEIIESRLSVADKMEESINQSLQQAEALKQSILKKAFEGRLVKY